MSQSRLKIAFFLSLALHIVIAIGIILTLPSRVQTIQEIEPLDSSSALRPKTHTSNTAPHFAPELSTAKENQTSAPEAQNLPIARENSENQASLSYANEVRLRVAAQKI